MLVKLTELEAIRPKGKGDGIAVTLIFFGGYDMVNVEKQRRGNARGRPKRKRLEKSVCITRYKEIGLIP